MFTHLSCPLQTYLFTVIILSNSEKLSIFRDLWRDQLWQWLEKGCWKPELGVWEGPCGTPGEGARGRGLSK